MPPRNSISIDNINSHQSQARRTLRPRSTRSSIRSTRIIPCHHPGRRRAAAKQKLGGVAARTPMARLAQRGYRTRCFTLVKRHGPDMDRKRIRCVGQHNKNLKLIQWEYDAPSRQICPQPCQRRVEPVTLRGVGVG